MRGTSENVRVVSLVPTSDLCGDLGEQLSLVGAALQHRLSLLLEHTVSDVC